MSLYRYLGCILYVLARRCGHLPKEKDCSKWGSQMRIGAMEQLKDIFFSWSSMIDCSSISNGIDFDRLTNSSIAYAGIIIMLLPCMSTLACPSLLYQDLTVIIWILHACNFLAIPARNAYKWSTLKTFYHGHVEVAFIPWPDLLTVSCIYCDI